MHSPFLLTRTAVLLAAVAGALTLPAHAADLVNGGFETGFSGWTRLDQLGGDGTFSVQSGTLSPINGGPVPAPPAGTAAAMSDGMGPGSHVLYQDFTVPAPGAGAAIGFSVFVGNQADAFSVQSHLDFSTPALNQQARIDLMLPGADPFSLAAADILLNLYQTAAGDPTVSGYTGFLVDVTSLFLAHQGETLRFRVAEVDNVNIFNLGIDDIGIRLSDPAVPEASTWAAVPAVLGLGAFTWLHRRRRASAAVGTRA